MGTRDGLHDRGESPSPWLQPASISARIERPAAAAMGYLPFGIAAIDRVLPGGGLDAGRLHEILGRGGDEEDGALAAAFVAGILGRLHSDAGNGMVLWCLPRRIFTDPVCLPTGSIPGISC